MSPAWARTQKNPSWAPAEQTGPLRHRATLGIATPRNGPAGPGFEPRRAHPDVLRELTALTSEVSRLKIAMELESAAHPSRESHPSVQSFQERLDLAESQRFRLREYLDSAGWALPELARADRDDRAASA